jgi:hypothetical protein
MGKKPMLLTDGASVTETLTSDGAGRFIFNIRVTLGDISSAQVKATDVASGSAAIASI